MTPPSFFYVNLFHGIRFYDIVSMISLALVALAIIWISIRILVSLIKIITGGKPKKISTREDVLITLCLGPLPVSFILLSYVNLISIVHFHYLFAYGTVLLIGLSLILLCVFLRALWSLFSADTIIIISAVSMSLAILVFIVALISIAIPSVDTKILLGMGAIFFLISLVLVVISWFTDTSPVKSPGRTILILIVSTVCLGGVAASFMSITKYQRKCEAIPQLGNGSDLIQRIYKSGGYGRIKISLDGSDLMGGIYEFAFGGEESYQQAIMIGHDNDGIAEYGSKREDFDNLGAILHPRGFKRIHLFAMKDHDLYHLSAIYKSDTDGVWLIEKPISSSWENSSRATKDTRQLIHATLLLVIGEIFGSGRMVEAGKKIQMKIIARSLREQVNTTLFYNPPCE